MPLSFFPPEVADYNAPPRLAARGLTHLERSSIAFAMLLGASATWLNRRHSPTTSGKTHGRRRDGDAEPASMASAKLRPKPSCLEACRQPPKTVEYFRLELRVAQPARDFHIGRRGGRSAAPRSHRPARRLLIQRLHLGEGRRPGPKGFIPFRSLLKK